MSEPSNIVIVESPAKAQTINRYLGSDYKVLASYGHIRDLESKNGSVDPNNNFAMTWSMEVRSAKIINDIANLVKKAKVLFLATDHDREGEAISWHIQQVLEEKKALNNVEVKRIVFNEITKNAIKDAIKNPKEVNRELVDSYLARRALDYLVGFSISPVLWRKLPGAKSAGRVQSVTLRLIVEREKEIEAFKSREYWTVMALCLADGQQQHFKARLTHLDGKKLEKFDLNSEILATQAVSKVSNGNFVVTEVEKKQQKRNPAAPFITSTLQQESARKLGFSASKTMQIAQKLYEGIKIESGEVTGLITYMRTDSVHMAQEAVMSSRQFIENSFGKAYLPSHPRVHKSRAKNAQEAHEAVRPTDFNCTPEKVKNYLENDQYSLYELIWKRALASQMESALFDQVGVNINDQSQQITLRANGSTLVFDGFLRLYQEGVDDPKDNEEEEFLPSLKEKEKILVKQALPEQHFTQPPPRYTEASLVKKLEELGIGRPSTYAPVLSVIQERDYAKLEKRQFIPTDRGRLVTSFLVHYFNKYVQYEFTASLEEQLDDVSEGKLSWLEVMKEFWHPFIENVEATKSLKTSDVIDVVQAEMMHYLFPGNLEESRRCPKCKTGTLNLKPSRYGAFIGCDQYPTCDYTKQIDGQNKSDENNLEPRLLGNDLVTQLPITMRKGPYGLYLQWGEGQTVAGDNKTKKKDQKIKPKRVSIPSNIPPDQVTLDIALKLAGLPLELGNDNDGNTLYVNIGRFGPYVKCGEIFCSIPKQYDFLQLTLDQAIALVSAKKSRVSKNGKAIITMQKPKTKPKKTGKANG